MSESSFQLQIVGGVPSAEYRVFERDQSDDPPPPLREGSLDEAGEVTLSLPRSPRSYVIVAQGSRTAIVEPDQQHGFPTVHLTPS
jgi:hypothetical protein